ncbi:hypothetical protein Clacol_008322 [Clathrus columnatus]|uniref:MaoC-like domain-containing protein n=1 Tax=Clathrus columnatus TaxID=1419009 RepID=A0AAV5AQ93_9AGAM|nr:hypothetical protein Clacol_008322 [Clathrus columnatus]
MNQSFAPLDPNFAAFPTYPVTLAMKLDNSDVIDYRASITGDERSIEGLPKLNPDRIVHGTQYIEILKPLPLVSGEGWKLHRRIVGIHENKSGVIIDQEGTLIGPDGEIYSVLYASFFNLGLKAYGKPFSKRIGGAPVAKPPPKDHSPKYTFVQQIAENQAILHRLSGDYNTLHIEPDIGIQAGFGGVILQGLGTYAFVARGILDTVVNGRSAALKAFGCLPDELQTSIWEVGVTSDGFVELSFVTKNLTTGKFGLTSLLHLYQTQVLSSDFDTNESFKQLTTNWRSYFSSGEEQIQIPSLPEEEDSTAPTIAQRANAAIVMLARNMELEGAVSSMKQLEDRFNKNYNYPWIFLNNEEFSEEFKRRTSMLTNANVSYGLIPKKHWYQPNWIDEKKATAGRRRLQRQHVIYAMSSIGICVDSTPEPDVRFYCDIDYDPFLMMQNEGKVYGFNMALTEFQQTIPTLWQTVKEFTDLHPEYIHPDNALGFLSHDGGETYSLCHFWSNFEIADMEFWRGEAYSAFFEHLDKAGGFYYERWGDAPVHSIAAGLFLSKQQIHFFSDIGYKHSILQHCPQGDLHTSGKCWCNYYDNYDYQESSCLRHFDALFPVVNQTEVPEEEQKVAEEVVPDIQQD